MPPTLILDLDASVSELAGAVTIPLGDWQESIRFGCGMGRWAAFRKYLDSRLPADYGTVLMGSGDFHHLSHLLLQRVNSAEPFDVVVFDNHPDNMRFPFGIHCGSWVRHAAALPQVRKIHVVGITSGDVGWRHAWENHLAPLYRGKVCYWTLGVDTRWTRRVGLAHACHSFADSASLFDALTAQLAASPGAVYLSIDKDVLHPDVAHTNWDQGCLGLAEIERVIAALAGRLIGSDITGEISLHHYQTRWKRWLSALDAQPAVSAERLAEWQAGQMAVNRRLLAALAAASGRDSVR